MLLDMAATTRLLLYQKKGDVGGVVEAIGDTLCAPNMDGDKKRVYLGRRHRVDGAKVLGRIAWEGVPAEIHTRSNLKSQLAYRDN